MSILEAIKTDGYRLGDCRMIQYSRTDHSILKPGFLGELYFALAGNRYNKRSGDGILQALFCGMSDLSFDGIVSYLANQKLAVLGVQNGDSFELAGFCFPTVMIGAGEDRSCFAAYGFLPRFWGTDEQEVLSVLGLSALFCELRVQTILGVRYIDNWMTARYMERFGFRDCGTLPRYLARRGRLESAVVSELSRERFEGVLERMLTEEDDGQGRRQSRSRSSAGDAEQ